MPALVGYVLLFVAVGIGFIFVHLLIGALIRPRKPDPEKKTIYECGEPTVGSAWVQFDLRFYVVALLFVIFDVEMAFFFPWAVVFGQSNQLADARLPNETRAALSRNFYVPAVHDPEGSRAKMEARFEKLMAIDLDRATPEQVAELVPPSVRG